MNGYGHFVPALFWATCLLVRDLCVPGRGLHGLCAARGRGLAAGAQPRSRGRRRVALAPAAGGLLAAGRCGLRRLVLLQRARAQRISHGGRPPSSAGRLRAQLQEIRTSAAAQGHGRRGQRSTFIPSAAPSTAPAASRCRTRALSRSRRSTSPINTRPCRNVQFDRPFHLVSRSPRDLYCHLCARSAACAGRGDDADFLRRTHDARLSRRQRAARSSPTTALSSTRSFSPTSATTAARNR